MYAVPIIVLECVQTMVEILWLLERYNFTALVFIIDANMPGHPKRN